MHNLCYKSEGSVPV